MIRRLNCPGCMVLLQMNSRSRLIQALSKRFGRGPVDVVLLSKGIDFFLLKLYAFRDVDFEDLRLLQPTAHELDFVRQPVSLGLMRKPTEGYRKVLSVPPNIMEWLAHFPVG